MALNDGTFAFANAEFVYNIGADAAPLSTLRTTTASDGPIAQVGDLVGWIEDLSGNGRHLVRTTTPAAELSRTHALGGKRSLYNALKQVQYQATTTLPAGNNVIYAAVFYAPPTTNIGVNSSGTVWSENGVKNGFWRRNTGSTHRWSFWETTGTWSEAASTPTLHKPCILIWQFVDGVLQFWKDGSKNGTGSTTYNFSGTTPNIRIFYSGNFNEYCNGQIAFLGRWNVTASDADIEALTADLAANFSIDFEASYAPCTGQALFSPIGPGSGHIQGVGAITPGGDIVASWTLHIERYSRNGTLLESVPAEILTGQQHVCGGQVHAGKAYFGFEGPYADPTLQEIVTYDPTDLDAGPIDRFDISPQDDEISAISIVPHHGDNGVIYHADFNDSSVLHMYDLENPETYLGTFATGLASNAQMQGLAYLRPYFILGQNNATVWRCHEGQPGTALPVPMPSGRRLDQGFAPDGRTSLISCRDDTDTIERVEFNDYFWDWPTLTSGNKWLATWAAGPRRRRKLICGV